MGCRLCPLAYATPVIAAGLIAGAAFSSGWGAAPLPAQPTAPAQPKAADPAYALDFKMKRIDGKEEDLNTYKGKVVVFVNVASKCGYTAQYKALEQLYRDHKDNGLVILGFPANNFREQEPASNKEIAEFCSSTYEVTFPMFEKISVKDDDQHALYKKLTSQPAPIGGDPKWNFTKFVADKEGKVVARFDAKGDGKSRGGLEPDFVKKVEELLGVAGKKEEKKQAPSGS
jgi:glutathione peroxidase